MPVIKKKNILGLSAEQQQTVWDAIRHQPTMRVRIYVRDIFPLPLVGGFSAGARGVVVFLFGEDPGEVKEELSDADLNAIADANAPLPPGVTKDRRAPEGTKKELDHLMEAAAKGVLPEADRRES